MKKVCNDVECELYEWCNDIMPLAAVKSKGWYERPQEQLGNHEDASAEIISEN